MSDESDATNNCSDAVAVTVGAAPAPDLVVDAPTVSTSAPTAGASFTLSVTVRNQGNGRLDSTSLSYYRSTDATITIADTEVGTDSVFRLDASGSGDEWIRLTAPSEEGTYYYGACVDSVSDESDATNNCSDAVAVTVGAAPAPDLVVDTPTVSESAPTAGASFKLNATVRNQGNGASSSTTLRYYQSADSTITTGDTAVGTDSVSSLDASSSGDESISLTAPSTAGAYYYGACLDGLSGESDTTNNCSIAVVVTVGAAPAPDLVVDTPTVTTSAPTAGSSFTLSVTVRNQGNGSAGLTTLRYYRSTDSTITIADTEVGTDSVFRLDASASGDESIRLTAPTEEGTYYYGACVDSVSDESDVTNNCSSAVAVTVGAAPAPDLVVGAPTVSTSAPTAGARFMLSATVRNQGNGRSDSTTLRYYRSTDSTITTSDTGVGRGSVSRLNASASGDESISLTAPSTAGAYYYGACVDSVSGESDTTNNCSAAVTVTVSGQQANACATAGAVSDAAANPGLVTDCEKLLAAKDTLRGTASLNWSASIPIDNWRGIAISGTPKRVTKLVLSRDRVTGRLNGRLPAELGDLAVLTTLKLSENQLTGTIPPELGNLANLTELNLWDNQLTGAIPAKLGDLPNLRSLILNNNDLSSRIPSELGNFDRLETLNLRHNQLTGVIPPELGRLSSLVRIDLLDNSLTGSIPPELGRLQSIEKLELNGNQLTGSIPVELGNLTNLTQLQLNHNQLSGDIPSELGNLINLTELSLHQNRLSGDIPSELGNLTNLQHLKLAGNQLTGCIPEELLTVQFTDIASLGLPDCYESPPTDATCATGGAVSDAADNPDLVSDCNSLLEAIVTLKGQATLNWSPSTLITSWDGVTVEGSPARVTKLTLTRRGLFGTLPPELGNLSKLTYIYISSNHLSGGIPAELSRLTELTTLLLGNNELTGNIPRELGSLANLTRLLLNSNQLSGAIPPELGNLANLTELNLGWNRLTGEIPSDLGNLSKLERLTLTVNQLTGCVPANLEDQLTSYLFDRSIGFCSVLTSPSAPTGLTATADGQTETDLSWRPPSDDGGANITGYRIEVSTDGSNWSDLEANIRSTNTSYSHTGLTAGSTRHYRVSAINSVGTGPASNVDDATTEAEANSAPEAVGSIPDQTIVLGTELNVDVSPYFKDPDNDSLTYTTSSRQLFNKESVSGSTVTLLLSTSAILCDPAKVTVTAQDEGGLVATQKFTVRRVNNPPVASSGVFPPQTLDVGESIPLYMANWFSDPDYCDSRLTYLAETSDASIVTASGSVNRVTIVGVAVGRSPEKVTVTARDSEGLEASLDILVWVLTEPGAPTGLTATADGQTRIDLLWSAPSDDGGTDINGYRIEVSTDGSSWSNFVINTRSTSTSYSHTGLTAGSTRHYRVSAINLIDTGPASNVDDATTESDTAATVPGAPAGLTATADGQTEIDLLWTAPSDDGGADITGYKIEVSTNGSSWSDLLADTGNTSTSYSHTGLTAGSTRHYRVSAINSEGTGAASNTDSATTAEEAVSEGTCTVDLVVQPGERCSHPGKSAEFWVDSDGIGHYLAGVLEYRSDSTIELRNTNINGVTYTFVASKQDDGSWLVEEVG